jgi:ketosteroid isomerase-like protein
MSEENVELARQALEAFDRRDRAAWLAFLDQECEVVTDRFWPEAAPVRGPEAAWEFYVKVNEPFERYPIGNSELVDAGADKVLVHLRNEVHGRASGAEVEINYWVGITFREGRVVRHEWFADRAEALEAVGLRDG